MTRKHVPPTAPLLPQPISLCDVRTVTGAGLGRTIGVPTINIDLSDVPRELPHGIFACFVMIGRRRFNGALHYGSRPAVKAGIAMEVHLIDAALPDLPSRLSLTIIGRIRDVQNFPSLAAMRKQIAEDVETARAMLRV